MTEHITATNMMWQPAMIRLTQVPSVTVDDGAPVACYVNPAKIVSIFRGNDIRKSADGSESRTTCTIVVLEVGGHVGVEESPQTVAMLRDRALGVEAKLSSVE